LLTVTTQRAVSYRVKNVRSISKAAKDAALEILLTSEERRFCVLLVNLLVSAECIIQQEGVNI